MVALLITLHVLVSIFLIFVILLQPGKGDGMGSAFGGGGAGSALGSRGSVTFLAKVTEVCAVIFMCTSLILAYRSSHSASVVAARKHIAAQDQQKKDDAAKGAPGAGSGAAPVQLAPPAGSGSAAAPAAGSGAAAPAAPAAGSGSAAPAK